MLFLYTKRTYQEEITSIIKGFLFFAGRYRNWLHSNGMSPQRYNHSDTLKPIMLYKEDMNAISCLELALS